MSYELTYQALKEWCLENGFEHPWPTVDEARIMAYLRDVGSASKADIRWDLGLTEGQLFHALAYLCARDVLKEP